MIEPTAPPSPHELSNLALEAPTLNGIVTEMYAAKTMGVGLDLKTLVTTLDAQTKEINKGDKKLSEAILHSQAQTLNAIFLEMARRAAMNMGHSLDATEAYMRLGLKAQNQCRATLETLSIIKNPPTEVAKQVIEGPQQVNTLIQVDFGIGEIQNQPNQLTENNELHQDTRTPRLESNPNPTLEAMGALHRTQVPRG